MKPSKALVPGMIILYRRGFTGIVNHFLESLDKPSSFLITDEQVMETHELVDSLNGD